MKTWGWSMLALLVAAGCIRFPPDLRYALRVVPQEALLEDGRYYFDAEDSTTVFEQEGFRLKREALFRRHTFVFKGDAYTGKVVFAPLYAEVGAITVAVEDMVLRVDAFDRPKEVTSAAFAFAVAHEVAPVPPAEEAAPQP